MKLARSVFCCALGLAALAANGSDGEIALTLGLNKDRYVLGEPVTVTMTLRSNRSDAAIHGGLDLYSYWSILYRHESEASFHQYNEDHLDVSGGSDILIPAQGLSFSVTLAHDKGRVYNPGTDTTEKILTFFGAPGTYFFQAKVRNRREFIISNTVAVRVSAPEGDNAEAWKLWKDPEVTAVVHERTTFFSEDERQSGLAKLRAIAARFPSTIYAGYARRRLAAVDGTPAGQDRTDSPAPSQTGAAPAAATTPPSPAPVAATEPEAPGNWYKWAGVGAVLILAVTVLIWKFRR